MPSPMSGLPYNDEKDKSNFLKLLGAHTPHNLSFFTRRCQGKISRVPIPLTGPVSILTTRGEPLYSGPWDAMRIKNHPSTTPSALNSTAGRCSIFIRSATPTHLQPSGRPGYVPVWCCSTVTGPVLRTHSGRGTVSTSSGNGRPNRQ